MQKQGVVLRTEQGTELGPYQEITFTGSKIEADGQPVVQHEASSNEWTLLDGGQRIGSFTLSYRT